MESVPEHKAVSEYVDRPVNKNFNILYLAWVQYSELKPIQYTHKIILFYLISEFEFRSTHQK